MPVSLWSRIVAGCITLVVSAGVQAAAPKADVMIWRLDCGQIMMNDAAPLSDAGIYNGKSRRLSVGCYLIRHGKELMLWDAGLPDLVGRSSNPVSAHRRAAGRYYPIGAKPLSLRSRRPGDDVFQCYVDDRSRGLGCVAFREDALRRRPGTPCALAEWESQGRSNRRRQGRVRRWLGGHSCDAGTYSWLHRTLGEAT